MSPARLTRRALLSASASAAVVVLLAGCTDDPLAEQYREGSNKGYIAGDGSVMEIAEDDRGDAISFSGVDQDGGSVDSADFDGDVVVVNFWYASCAPCRVEAPLLEELNQKYADEDVTFVGVNLRDQAGTASAFDETYGITYPSIIDVNDGAVKLAFSGDVPPNSVPTTIVLDKQGRVAARILGALEDTSILDTLVSDALAEA